MLIYGLAKKWLKWNGIDINIGIFLGTVYGFLCGWCLIFINDDKAIGDCFFFSCGR